MWIDEQLELCEKATEGPWLVVPHPRFKNSDSMLVRSDAGHQPWGSFAALGYLIDRNARFASAARTGYPRALRLLKDTLKTLEKIEERLSLDETETRVKDRGPFFESLRHIDAAIAAINNAEIQKEKQGNER